MPDNETEIHIIPDEFYGGVKRLVPSMAPISSFGAPATAAVLPTKFTPARQLQGLPQLAFFKTPKFIVIAGSVVFVIIISGVAYYYIRQANIARQQFTTPSAPTPVVQPTPPPPAPIEAATSTEEIAPAAATSTPIQPPFSIIFPFKNYTKTIDTDNDGLTDEEEKIYGTDPALPDTDSDGFLDTLEIQNLYNPIGFKPVRLFDSGKIKIYENPVFSYSIFYPGDWVAQSLDPNNKDVMFTAATGEFVEVLVEDNPLKMTAEAWYLGQSPGVDPSQLEYFITKDKLAGVKSPDGLVAYISFEDKIFAINYNIGLKTEVNFLNTFEMMINSFRPQGGFADLPFGGVTATSTATSTPL
ncbi:MAG: hypothetical protein HZC05_02700 [Candidatus Magasanikbacteria bacterium]|nr:hypothetical protein [Candidatus Magasanikbacteria bacterium]